MKVSAGKILGKLARKKHPYSREHMSELGKKSAEKRRLEKQKKKL